MFKSALDLKKSMKDDDYVLDNPQRIYIEKRMNVLLNYNIPDNHKELITFKKRLIKYRNYLFTFSYHPKIPPDNNASERSITDTCIKNGQKTLPSLNIIANLHTD
ncbi:MAG: hypothetical protein U9N51_11760 [Bacteroidota bacterium]|nr:hypothetical protein [Bacteroidota bacterium]